MPRAVAHHAMALILAIARRLPEARDNQARHHWRPMMGDFALREDELTGKTLLVVGLGGIGGRLARLATAFEMTVVGVRQDPAKGADGADTVHALADLPGLLPQADYVALTCPLTPQTQGLADAAFFARMKPGATLVNVARGGCVVEPDLIAALGTGRVGAAALDVTMEETAARGLAAVGHARRVHHLPPRRRDTQLRGERGRDPAGQSRPPMAGRDGAAQPGGLERDRSRLTADPYPSPQHGGGAGIPHPTDLGAWPVPSVGSAATSP